MDTRRSLCAAMLGAGLAVAGVAPAQAQFVIPYILQVQVACVFQAGVAEPFNVHVQFSQHNVSGVTFRFRNAAGQEHTFFKMLAPFGFTLPAGTYTLLVKAGTQPRLVGYDGIVVLPYVVETVNGQKVCKNPLDQTTGKGSSRN